MPMPTFLNKFKAKDAGHQEDSNGPTFNILPHPAKTNDPADVEPTAPGGGLRSDPVMGAFKAKGPYIPNQEMLNKLDKPLSREELHARQAQLNKEN